MQPGRRSQEGDSPGASASVLCPLTLSKLLDCAGTVLQFRASAWIAPVVRGPSEVQAKPCNCVSTDNAGSRYHLALALHLISAGHAGLLVIL